MAGTWQLLTPTSSGTHKLTSAGDTIDSGTIAAKDNLKVIVYVQDSGSNVAPRFRLNGQSGDHYYSRRNENGSTSDDVYNSSPNIDAWKWYQTGSGTDVARYYVFTIKNTKGKHKLAIGTVVESTTTGDGDVLRKTEFVGRWNGQNDTSITSIQVVNTGSNDFGVGSYIAVWGASDDTISDEKTTLTNVPDNTRYEEVDTRKIYRSATNLIDGSDLKAYYKFDESSGSVINVAGDVTDNASLGSNADMTIGGTGTVSYGQTGTPSKLGNGMSFPATSSTSGTYGTCGTSVSQFNFLHGGTPKWTIAWWQKTSTAGGTNRQIFGTAVGDTKAGIVIYYYNNNLRVYMAKTHPIGNNQPISTNDSSVSNSDFTGMETDGNWHLYVVTMDFSLSSNNCKICKDNGTKHTANKHGPNTPDAITQNSVNSLGFRHRISESGGYIVPTAEYCEVSVWNRVLTDAEITQLYNSGAGFQLDTGEQVWKDRGSA